MQDPGAGGCCLTGGRPRRTQMEFALTPAEPSIALFDERCDALGEVVGARHLALDLRLELQLGVHALEEPGVELALGAGVGGGRAGREAIDERLAAGPTRSYAGTKRQLNAWLYGRMDDQLALEADIQQESAESGDFLEGVQAFLEKRPPSFGGR